MASNHSFHQILEQRKEILVENIPFDLSSALIEKGIIEPADHEKLKQIRKTSGLKDSQREFTDMLIRKTDWTEEDKEGFKACLEELNESFLIQKIFHEKINVNMTKEAKTTEDEAPFFSGRGRRGGANIQVIGNNNKVVTDSTIEINNKYF